MNPAGLVFVVFAVLAWFAAPAMTRAQLRLWRHDERGVGYGFLLKLTRASAVALFAIGLALWSGLIG